MRGFVVTRSGTFGVVDRIYRNTDGVAMAVVMWGPLRWRTPVYVADIHACKSCYESEGARLMRY